MHVYICIFMHTHIYVHINTTELRPNISVMTIMEINFSSPIKEKLFKLIHKIEIFAIYKNHN